ncbi:MAG: TonB-dependent receptor [Thermoanaerobaculia bacterium]|nr:TonB-dependent receptor [Thermoanaerobaculia bacterium]
MVQRSRTGFRGFALAVAMLGIASGLFAQSQTGNVYGSVKDDKGEPLPGVTLTLSGGGAPSIQVSDVQGQFRFVGIYPGTYKLEGALQGFSPVVYPSLIVNLNRNTTVELMMNAAVEETITITAESPLLDARKVSTGATIDKTELEKIPTARDPWVILQSTPGVLVDRVNVGGNESGQQSGYTGNGDDGTNSTWSIDGVEITDIGAIGSSSSYYDFDAFEEMQVTTGGSDSGARTGGVGINLVTKRGTNEWRGSARYLVSDQDWQSDSDLDASDFGQPGAWNSNRTQTTFANGNRIVEVLDYGFEVGGPILKDKLWVWGSYGENDIKLLTSLDFPDNSLLETWNAKLNWQVAQNNSATAFFSNNDKTKIGRNAAPNRPPETTWNQAGRSTDPDVFGFFSERPSVAKLEDTHIFGSNFFLTGMYSEVSGGFELVPQGGTSTDQLNAELDDAFVWHRTFIDYYSIRPQEQYKADGSYFFTAGNLNNELKFGVNLREATVNSYSRWPGFGIDLNFYKFYGYAYNIAQISRESKINYEVEYTNAYIQDTLTAGNLTANIGLRYDVQDSRNLPATLEGVPQFPTLLPTVEYAGANNPFEWKTLSPRLGLTYALGEEKKTLLRASYSRFAEQMGGGVASFINPGYPGAYVYQYYNDLNGDGASQPNEVIPGILFTNAAYNPFTGGYVQSFFADPDLDAPMSDEIVVGIEHALLPEFVVGATVTWRNETDILEAETLVFDGDAFSAENINQPGRLNRRDDYVPTALNGTLPDGTPYTQQAWVLREGVSTRGGQWLENGDREREYLGVALTFNKRLSDNWMMRGNVSWNDWEWSIPESEREYPQQFFGGGNQDGDRVLTCSGTGSGAKGNVCISSAWSYSINGMYQVAPDKAWGFNVAAALNGREGYSFPYFRRFNNGDLPRNCVGGFCTNITDRPDDYKADDVHTVDLRIEKEFKFDRVGLTVGADVFNVFNENTILQRELRLNQTRGDFLFETLSPRIFRLGARLSFN